MVCSFLKSETNQQVNRFIKNNKNFTIDPFALENNLPEYLYNVGSGKDIKIKELAETIQNTIGHKGKIIWDASNPDGPPRKLMDVSKMKELGWEYTTELELGIEKTYQWFLENINKIKEVKL
jgi:GDP-L-fucose synthase